MKPGNVASVKSGPETGTCDVTSSSTESGQVDEKRNLTSRIGIMGQGKTGMQANPTRAPLEMANAIRRRRETSILDYTHTLPSGGQQHLPRPLYRAVIRGPLTSETAVCQLSSIGDAGNEKEYQMVIKRNGFGNSLHCCNGVGGQVRSKTVSNSSINAGDLGLTVSGFSIKEVKNKQQQQQQLQQQANLATPRSSSNGWKGATLAGGCNKQRKLSGQNSIDNINNKSTVWNDSNYNNNYSNNNNSNKLNADIDVVSKTNASNGVKQTPSLNDKPIQKTPRLSLTSRQQTGDVTDSKRLQLSPRSESVTKKGFSVSLDNSRSAVPHSSRSTLLRQSSLPVTSSDPKACPDSNGNAVIRFIQPASTETNLAKRKFSNEVDNCRRMSTANSLSSSACLQFANSILGAFTADFNQMYTICQAKVRYAEFIEQSQPHRLGERGVAVKDGFIEQSKHEITTKETYNNNNNSNNNNHNVESYFSKHNTKELPSPSSSSPSSSLSSSPSSNLASKHAFPNSSSNTNKNSPPVRLAPITHRTNKYITLRDPDKDNISIGVMDKPVTIITESDLESPRVKMTRPILKSSKTDIDNNQSSIRQLGDKTDANNNSNVNNRLVRFNVNHEVREFAPSEPVRYP